MFSSLMCSGRHAIDTDDFVTRRKDAHARIAASEASHGMSGTLKQILKARLVIIGSGPAAHTAAVYAGVSHCR